MNEPSPHPHCNICAARRNSIFCELGDKQLESLDCAKVTNFYKRGQVLFYEGNACKGIFCLFDGKVKICKMNVDECQKTPAQFGVRGIPTLILFKDGKVVDQVVGVVPKHQLEGMLNKAL